VLAIFIVASVTAVLVPMLRRTTVSADPVSTATAAPQGPRGAFACIEQRAAGGGSCQRQLADLSRRAVLSQTQQDTVRPTAEAIATAVEEASRVDGARPSTLCDPSPPRPCRLVYPALDVASVRRALTAAGFPTAVVRRAQGDDPAPAGAVLFAVLVPVGPACVLGDLSGDSGSAEVRTVGTLSDGSCLPAATE
jgi:Tfp pilus assembly major pilin PilA